MNCSQKKLPTLPKDSGENVNFVKVLLEKCEFHKKKIHPRSGDKHKSHKRTQKKMHN